MKRIFSLKLYVEGLKRIKIAGIAAAIAVILLNAAIPLIGILENRRMYGMTSILGWSVTSVEPYEFLPFGLLMLAFGAVFAFSMFSFLNERNRSDFFHAIPHKRICVYLSFIAAIFTWIFAILTVSAGVNALLYGFSKFHSVNFSVVIVTPLVLMLASIMIAAFMTLAMTLTGTVISNSLIFVLLLLFGRTIGQIFVTALRELAPIISQGTSFLNYLEFEFSLPFALLSGDGFANLPLIIYTVFVTLLVFAAGAVCYVRRRSETATKSAPSKLLQHVYRSAISLPFFLFMVVSIIVDGFDASVQLLLLILALLVYCIFELMTTKKIKSLVKALPMLVIPILLSGIFTGAVFIARNAVLNQVPSVDEVESIGKKSSISSYLDPTYRELRTQDTFIDAEEAKEIVLHALERNIDNIRNNRSVWYPIEENGEKVDICTRITVQIRLENGRTLSRYIGMTEKEYERLMSLMLESYDYLEAYFGLPTSREIDSLYMRSYEFSKDEVKRLWASFLLEFSSLSREEKLAYVENSYRGDELNAIVVSGTYRLKSFISNYPLIYKYVPKTTQMYLEMAAEAGIIQSDMKVLEEMAEHLSKGDSPFAQSHFSLVATLLTGEEAGSEFFVESLKTETEIPKEEAVKMLEFLTENGECSYDPDNILVRFSVQLFDLIKYDYDPDIVSVYSYHVSAAVDAETSTIWNTQIILALTQEEWEEFRTLIAPYYYR